MSNSYAMIEQHSDTEWKFARTKLWMSYFEESATLPPPFNIFPNMKIFSKLFRSKSKRDFKRESTIVSLHWRCGKSSFGFEVLSMASLLIDFVVLQLPFLTFSVGRKSATEPIDTPTSCDRWSGATCRLCTVVSRTAR